MAKKSPQVHPPWPRRAYQFYFQQTHTLAGFPSWLLADLSNFEILEEWETNLFLRPELMK